MITTSDRSLTDYDLHLLTEGTHYRSFEKMGAHVVEGGAHFAVWAPNAASVSVIGDFNDWTPGAAPMRLRPEAGVWEHLSPARIMARVTSTTWLQASRGMPPPRPIPTPSMPSSGLARHPASGIWIPLSGTIRNG